MALPPLPPEGTPFLDTETGRMNQLWRAFFRAFAPLLESVADDIDDVDGSKAGLTQTWEVNFQVPEVEAGTITPILKSKRARTVTEIVTICSSGTCTLTPTINGGAMGGSANSVSSSEQEQAHASSNTLAAGDDLFLTASSVSSCLNMVVSVRGTYSLDA